MKPKTVPVLTDKEIKEFLRRLAQAGDGVLRDLGTRLLADMEWFRDRPPNGGIVP